MSRGSITQRITLVLLGGMLCLLAVLVLYVWQVASTARSDSRAYALSLSESITQSLEEKTASITKTASSLAQNAYVEAYYASDDINERAKNIRVFNSLALNAIADRPDILAVGLLDLDGSSITVGTQLDAVLLSTLKRTYPFLLEPDAFSPFFTRAIRMEGKIPYYAYILPCTTRGTRRRSRALPPAWFSATFGACSPCWIRRSPRLFATSASTTRRTS